jgi:hypothetical protein
LNQSPHPRKHEVQAVVEFQYFIGDRASKPAGEKAAMLRSVRYQFVDQIYDTNVMKLHRTLLATMCNIYPQFVLHMAVVQLAFLLVVL